ncbi:endonuclease domain-containing protein [Methylopila sp. 73B]|uniref:endonuclease domain-containing protein n=1 Tax=Methylopila sp. 73B TaxID=1120792 RepID=UPI000379BEDB|nr:endonuclease domain-containing protein [Methylopila sp. 73B]
MTRDSNDSRPWAATDRAVSGARLDDFARANRPNPTDAERKLWRRLKQLDLGATHFRRQVPIGPYIADFACRPLRLVIEVDGGQHAESARDDARTATIEGEGWRVLRFWNNDVLRNIEGVMEAIVSEVGAPSCATPTPGPSPQGGGGSVALGSNDEIHLKRQCPPSPLRGGVRGGGGSA